MFFATKAVTWACLVGVGVAVSTVSPQSIPAWVILLVCLFYGLGLNRGE